MNTPRLYSYPFDAEVMARMRAQDRARRAERLARRSAHGHESRLRAFLYWIAG